MTGDLSAEIRSVLGSMLKGRESSRDFDRPLWKDLSETGFHLLGVPEEIGGSGGGLGELAVAVDSIAFHTAGAPLVESAFLAGWLLTKANLRVPGGLVVASLDEAHCGSASRLSGRLRVPWARHADQVVTIAKDADEVLVAVVPARGLEVVRAENLAGEPRDTLVLDDVVATVMAPVDVDAADLLRRGALARSIQLAAAARAVLETTQRHVGEREQFGRPLARFQAVQQHLAALAAEVTAMNVSADAAVLADDDVATAAAKATTSAGAHTVAAIGHQLHGALGYSREHHLGAVTTRLWSWREEFGNESHWQDQLADAVRADSWWPLITGGAR
ncbi:acyl-CoA dehydrogenase family protein [Amycolatopsis lurida]